MNKVYKGYELIKEIAEENIKEYSRFKVIVNNTLIGTVYSEGNTLFWENQEANEVKACTLTRCIFELIEDRTIDIDSIEEYQIPSHVPITALEEKLIDLINEDRKAIKHLNKEIQSIKNK